MKMANAILAGALDRAPRQGLACFDLGPNQTVLTWGDSRPLTQEKDWGEGLRGMLEQKHTPWQGGVVGWLGYEAGADCERMPVPLPDPWGLPVLCMWRVSGFCLLDRETERWQVSGSEQFVRQAQSVVSAPRLSVGEAHGGVAEPLSGPATQYRAGVAQIVAAIEAGDVYQTNLAWQTHCETGWNPGELWLSMRRRNPAERGGLLQIGDVSVVSNSPELFLEITDGLAQSVPIKGTAPLSAGPDGLEHSEKEQAELTMIADLVRNDLGRVAQTGSVRWEPRRVRQCGDLWHAEQRITADLLPHRDAIDAVRACFPPGSVTGAPKVAAMQQIRRLEAHPRGVYTGAMGLFDDNGDAHFNVAIRTITMKGNKARFHLGAGIVADSDPQSEWEETLAKGRQLHNVLAGAGRTVG